MSDSLKMYNMQRANARAIAVLEEAQTRVLDMEQLVGVPRKATNMRSSILALALGVLQEMRLDTYYAIQNRAASIDLCKQSETDARIVVAALKNKKKPKKTPGKRKRK